MQLFPQGVYFWSHTVWFWNNMMQSQNNTSKFQNNMKENGKQHKQNYPDFCTRQCVISEICNVVLKQHVKFQHHICRLETAIGPKSTLNNMLFWTLQNINFETTCVNFEYTQKNRKLNSNSQGWFSKQHGWFLNLHGVKKMLSSWLKYGKIVATCVGIINN